MRGTYLQINSAALHSYVTTSGYYFTEDRQPPSIRINTPLLVKEDSFGPITASHLYITDAEVEMDQLAIGVVKEPRLGQVVMEDDRGRGIVRQLFISSGWPKGWEIQSHYRVARSIVLI